MSSFGNGCLCSPTSLYSQTAYQRPSSTQSPPSGRSTSPLQPPFRFGSRYGYPTAGSGHLSGWLDCSGWMRACWGCILGVNLCQSCPSSHPALQPELDCELELTDSLDIYSRPLGETLLPLACQRIAAQQTRCSRTSTSSCPWHKQ